MSLGHIFFTGSVLSWVFLRFIWLREPIFCLERYILSRHRLCVCGPGPLRSTAGFLFRSELFCIRSGTVRHREQGFCFKPSISVRGPGPFGCGSCSLFGKIWFGSGSRFVLLSRVTYYSVCGLGPSGSRSRFFLEATYLSRCSLGLLGSVFSLGAGVIFAKDYCYRCGLPGHFPRDCGRGPDAVAETLNVSMM